MSFQAMAWAIKQVPRNTLCKLTLLILANYADEDGTCFPKQQMIAEQAECSLRSVKYALQQLREDGLLTDEKRWRKGGGQAANRYRLPLQSKSANSALMVGARVQATTGKSANRALISIEDTITEPITKEIYSVRKKKLEALRQSLQVVINDVSAPRRTRVAAHAK